MHTIAPARRVARPFRNALLTAALTVGLAHVPQSHAQWATAEVGPSLFAHIMNQVNTLTVQMQDYYKYAEDAVRWKATWDHYYQQIARFVSVVRNPTLQNKMTFEPIDPQFNVAEKCGAGPGFGLATVASLVTLDPSKGIVENQRGICARIQMLENQKYNAVVSYFKDVEPIIKQDLEKIDQQRQANNEQGTVQAVTEASERLANQQQVSEAELDRQLQGADQMIAALTKMQQTLAQQALKGKPNSVIGTLVKTATLEAALKAK